MQHLYVDYVKMRFFSLGLGTGAALQAVAASVVIMIFAYDPRSGAIHELAASYYAVFRASFLLCFWFLLWGVALFVWKRHGVDARGPDRSARARTDGHPCPGSALGAHGCTGSGAFCGARTGSDRHASS